jgi:folate-binding protein YgfZ
MSKASNLETGGTSATVALAPGTVGDIAEGVSATLRYGDLEAEVRALRAHAGLVDRSWAGRLEMLGADRHRFLNAYVTCDVKGLEPSQGVRGFVTSAQGRILATIMVLALEDRFWLELPAGTASSIADHLRRFLIADRVEIRELARLPLSLVGPSAAAMLAAAAGGGEMPGTLGPHVAARLAGFEVRIQRGPLLGVPAFTIWVEPQHAAAVVDALLALQAVPVGFEALEAIRVESGEPRFGSDFGPQNFPQETAIADAVSYTKGCYLGQEVVARIHYRGGVQRSLKGLLFDHQGAAHGTPLLFEGREAGQVGTVVHSPTLGATIGLSVLHRRAFAAGARLSWSSGEQSGEAEVRELPFVGSEG